jgi:hypothetical protein
MTGLRRWWHKSILKHTRHGGSVSTGRKVFDKRTQITYYVTGEGWICSCGEWFPL